MSTLIRPMRSVLFAGLLSALAGASGVAAVSHTATIVGTVTLTAADGGTFAGEGARVVMACGAGRTTRTEVADEHGAFRFQNVPVDSCSIEADVQGFVAQPVRVVTAADQVVGTDLHLGIAPLRVGVNVGGTEPPRELTARGESATAFGATPDFHHGLLKMPRRSCRADAGRRLERSASRAHTRSVSE
jgi:hypothetical protein